MYEPRDYQQWFYSDIQTAYKHSRAVIGCAPCGSGKTVPIVLKSAAAARKGRRVLITVPRIDLVYQVARTFREMGVPFGDLTSNEQIKLGTMQTVMRRDIPTDFIINDEAHYGLSDAWAARLNDYLAKGAWLLGLTASPIPGMDRVYTAMVCSKPVSWLTERGWLSDYRAFGPSQPDLSGLPVHNGDYGKTAAADLMSKPSITGSAVEHWRKMAAGLRTIAYTVSREHSRALVAAFVAAGIPAEHIDGETPHDQRQAMAARFARRETQLLSNVALFQLGYDLSSQVGEDVPIEAMLDEDPTRSVPKQIQKWGRVVRRKPNPAIILDSANNFRDLGMFPDSEMEWSISKGATRAKGVLPVSICKRCFAAFKTAPVCPYCGHERELTPREIELHEGELREIERERVAKVKRIEVGRAGSDLDALAKIAVARNYKRGWIAMRLKLKGHVVEWNQIERAMADARG